MPACTGEEPLLHDCTTLPGHFVYGVSSRGARQFALRSSQLMQAGHRIAVILQDPGCVVRPGFKWFAGQGDTFRGAATLPVRLPKESRTTKRTVYSPAGSCSPLRYVMPLCWICSKPSGFRCASMR